MNNCCQNIVEDLAVRLDRLEKLVFRPSKKLIKDRILICTRCQRPQKKSQFLMFNKVRETICKVCLFENVPAIHHEVVKRLWRGAQYRAIKTKRSFSILPEHITIPDLCPVLGISLDCNANDHATSPSIDRIDNTEGYTPTNIRVISSKANLMKQDASADELKEFAKFHN